MMPAKEWTERFARLVALGSKQSEAFWQVYRSSREPNQYGRHAAGVAFTADKARAFWFAEAGNAQ